MTAALSQNNLNLNTDNTSTQGSTPSQDTSYFPLSTTEEDLSSQDEQLSLFSKAELPTSTTPEIQAEYKASSSEKRTKSEIDLDSVVREIEQLELYQNFIIDDALIEACLSDKLELRIGDQICLIGIESNPLLEEPESEGAANNFRTKLFFECLSLGSNPTESQFKIWFGDAPAQHKFITSLIRAPKSSTKP